MRNDLTASLATALAVSLVGGRAFAQIPEPGDPQCVETYCSCEPSVGRPCDFDCAAYCGGASGGDSSGSSSNDGQVAPIFKLAAGVVVGAVVAGMFAVAPGHTYSLFSKRQSADEARKAWNEYREALTDLEETADHLAREAKRMDAFVAAAGAPPSARVATTYVPVAPARVPDRWAAGGACAEVLEANTALLQSSKARVETAAREALGDAVGLPATPADLAADARAAAREAVVGALGPKRFAAQRKELLRLHDEAKEYQEFIDALLACTGKEAVEANDCINAVLEADVPSALKAQISGLVGEGTTDALERVRKLASFYRGYVGDLQAAIEKQALSATRCR